MGTTSGPNIIKDGLILYLDAINKKSNIRIKQSSNILIDPNTWTTGSGGFSGYSANGSTGEQNRIYIDDDPWGGKSVSWRTTPDNVSGADGGWNSTYYSIDTSFTYRWVVWVRRYTTGTGGTFYFGLNPSPIRNDNNAVQSNPYFIYTAISNLTYNQWYMVVGHCFYNGYSDGNRHPDSGWYENGIKIPDKSYGNVGTKDVRWQSSTTTARHRTYHYYTTNIDSGIEFAFPRLDKCDGSEPTIDELINIGESKWVDLTENNNNVDLNGIEYNNGYFVFNGVNDGISMSSIILNNQSSTLSTWVYISDFNITKTNKGRVLIRGVSNYTSLIAFYNGGYGFETNTNSDPTESAGRTTPPILSSSIISEKWFNFSLVFNLGISYGYVNGNLVDSRTINNNLTFNKIGDATNFSDSYPDYFKGNISNFKIYDIPLDSNEILKNFNMTKSKFNI